MLKPSIATDEMIARFEREVQLASQLSHPNTIEIYDYGRTRDGVFFYAMEYLDGITLEELVNRGGPVPATRVIAILRQLCGSLREAHNRGLIHRDIKPQNVMLCERGGEYDVVKVLDFGLVKDLDRPDPRDITQFMKVLGTPVYMAPERIRNPADADVRADIYSVGALAYYLLTGRKVFEAQTDLDLTNQVLNAPPPRPSENTTQEIPEELDILVVRCLAKSPAERPQRMEDLLVVIYVLSAWYPWSQTKATDWWEAHRAQPAAAAPGQPPGVTPSRK
jgi:serine/threonine-protein kinase